MSIRKPIVAGQFYSADSEELRNGIENSFLSKLGPGKTAKRSDKKIKGVIVPHAGYVFSGACAAWSYNEIGESKFADTYIILGVNHSSSETCTSNEEWATPFGNVACDGVLIEKLKNVGIPIKNSAHHHEHSIETQLPFLQYVSSDCIKDLRIVPMMIGDSDYLSWSEKILRVVKSCDKKIGFICSSDFTHHGSGYGFTLFGELAGAELQKNIFELDKKAIDLICELDSSGFLKYCEKTGATICGKFGIAVMISIMKELGASRGELLKYYSSGDVSGDYSNSVGYCSIVFY